MTDPEIDKLIDESGCAGPGVTWNKLRELVRKALALEESGAQVLLREYERTMSEKEERIACLEQELDAVRTTAREAFIRAELADQYEEWLRDLGRISGCGHVDERLPRCIEEAFDSKLAMIATLETDIAVLGKYNEQSEAVIIERDKAEEAMSQAFYLVTGNSPQWSNQFGYPQALEEIGDALDVYKARCRTAQAAIEDRTREMDRAEQAEARVLELKKAIVRAIEGVPAQDGGGGMIVEHFDENGEYVGSEPVAPIAVIGSMVGVLSSALVPKVTAEEHAKAKANAEPDWVMREIAFAEPVTGGGWLVTLDCGHKIASHEKRVTYKCPACTRARDEGPKCTATGYDPTQPDLCNDTSCPKHYPSECTRCGKGGGPPTTEENLGWMCPECYAEVEASR